MPRCATTRRLGLGALVAWIGAAGAASGQGCPPPAQSIPAPALATVYVIGTGESFVAHVIDQAVVDEMVQIAAGVCTPRIVLGKVVTGTGGYNAPWSWHLDASTLELADFAVEICDARPSYVEQNLAYWAGGTYCPWGSYVLSVEPAAFLPEDITGDGAVDDRDLDRLTTCLAAPDSFCWELAAGCCATDIDGSRSVDCSDWTLLERAWTAGTPPVAPSLCRDVPASSRVGWGLLVSLLWLAAASALRAGRARLGSGALDS